MGAFGTQNWRAKESAEGNSTTAMAGKRWKHPTCRRQVIGLCAPLACTAPASIVPNPQQGAVL